MVEKVEPMPYKAFDGTCTEAICDMSAASHTDFHHVKPIKPLPKRKSEKNVPWMDCFTAPCKGGCPIEQDIPEYVELCRRALYGPALKLITEKNPCPSSQVPSAHTAVRINVPATSMTSPSRSVTPSWWRPTMATMLSWPPSRSLLKRFRQEGRNYRRRPPTGIAAAYFCGRAGIETTIFEREAAWAACPGT